jgi:hypothetical protein
MNSGLDRTPMKQVGTKQKKRCDSFSSPIR